MTAQARLLFSCLALILSLSLLTNCRQAPEKESLATKIETTTKKGNTPLDNYVTTPDPAFSYEVVDTIPGEGFNTYIIRMVSQRWLTEAEVKDPLWWHWITMVVPDEVKYNKALLFIGGGSRKREQPEKPDGMILQIAGATQSVVASLHNVPNQPMEFIGDDYGPRKEDELIAYGWRKFLEGGGKEEDATWLARLPMTKAAVRAMDVVSEISEFHTTQKVSEFVVAGGSKRGWTTWTTAAVDQRVVGIVPLVIDLLNVVPSFEHHWRAYGFWAPAVGNYEHEGIMEWQNSKEYKALLGLTEPYSFRDRYTMPKLIVNSTGDQFFLPDSWQFYWNDLPGEKHLRYPPNSEHSLDGTDALESLTAFYQDILTDTPRPEFDWAMEEGAIVIRTNAEHPATSLKLWQAYNPNARDFRVETIDRSWTATEIPLREDGTYRLQPDTKSNGYTAFFGELTFTNGNGMPFKLSTGVVITPDTYPHEAYVSSDPRGTLLE